MNERINELYRSCKPKEALASQDLYKSADVLLGSEVKKFAELIVQECMELVSATKDLAIEDGWNVDEAMSTAINDIEEHFGVEE
jgi:hypothetical protein